MSRAVEILRAVWWWAAFGAAVAWWTPTILVFVGRLAAARVRFGAVMAWGDLLKATGRLGAAERLYRAEAERCRARMAAVRARRGW